MEHSTRVALLLYEHHRHQKVLRLLKDIADDALVLSPDCINESLSEAIADCDLIIIETRSHLTPKQQRVIRWIRSGSLAPLVVLVDDKPESEIRAQMIESGIDAVIPLNSDSEAIAAHCLALVRRWRTHPYATPKFA